jgi:hypothetical protein
MANLAEYQKLTRVISSPWGTGADGAYSSATIPTLVKLSVDGVATETHFHATAGQFVANDIVLLHQTRGTGVGQWEINKVTVDTSGTYTVSKALQYTYTDSGASQAQVIKIPQYTSVTVETGTWTIPSWDGNVGGILTFACKGDLTVTGTISANGVNGNKGAGSAGGAGRGFIGGTAKASNGAGQAGQAYSGEGSVGGEVASTNANGSGGGGGYTSGNGGGSGGGGSHSTNGGSGGAQNTSAGGTGASTLTGSADLLNITFGGGGGGGARDGDGEVGSGAGGAGIILIMAKNVVSVNSIAANGGSGITAFYDQGGGGAGGSCLVVCKTATLGTDKIAVAGGAGGTGGITAGGDGGVGRIAVHHSGAITGTTTPAFTDVTDATLVEASGGSFIFNML